MKYNLGNFPKVDISKPVGLEGLLEILKNCREVWKWKMGFEQELREIVESDFGWDWRALREEILGDDSGRTVKEHKGPFVLYIKDPENYDSTDCSTSDD